MTMRLWWWVIGCCVLLCSAGASAQVDEQQSRREQLSTVNAEITRHQRALARLDGRESGLLGELEQLRTDLRLREAQVEEVSLRSGQVDAQIQASEIRLSELEAMQGERRDYLRKRLKQLYTEGADSSLQRLFAPTQGEDYWAGLRYASYLNSRDSRVLRAFRREQKALDRERSELGAIRQRLATLESELASARESLAASERNQRRALNRLRQDRAQRSKAVEELRGAAAELSAWIASPRDAQGNLEIDVRKFKGLLEWPASSKVDSRFGTRIHPRFKTEVPHPGWDFAGQIGDSIRSVFEGKVVYADWMRGYGLTVILDHGSGILSIYAHNSALLVSAGDQVKGGQRIAALGETGSLRGPLLYFELRDNGTPVDPKNWIKRR